MGEQTEHQDQPLSLPEPDPTTAAATTTTEEPKQQQTSPPPAATTITTTEDRQPPPTPAQQQQPATSTQSQTSTTSKIPFRPRKTRKLSSDATPSTSTAASTTIPPRIIPKPLSTEGEIAKALRHLKSSDPLLAPIIDVHHPPTFDSFHPPFLALTKSILYQQLAFKAGTSIYTRFISLCGSEAAVLPEAVLAITTHQLRQIGVSARKASYLHDLANKYKSGILSDSSIVGMDDRSLFTMLTMVKGIGSWSVHMFMIFSLHRPDVLPIGDLGVRKGVQLLYGLEQLPRPSQMDQLCEKWRPYRSVASWYMWRFAEAKGAPAITGVGEVGDHPSQLLDQINSISNLGPYVGRLANCRALRTLCDAEEVKPPSILHY